jgi:hypothetical protein
LSSNHLCILLPPVLGICIKIDFSLIITAIN